MHHTWQSQDKPKSEKGEARSPLQPHAQNPAQDQSWGYQRDRITVQSVLELSITASLRLFISLQVLKAVRTKMCYKHVSAANDAENKEQ